MPDIAAIILPACRDHHPEEQQDACWLEFVHPDPRDAESHPGTANQGESQVVGRGGCLAPGSDAISARLAKSPAPFGIAQKALPISLDELITAIQEQFAAELREYHITMRREQE